MKLTASLPLKMDGVGIRYSFFLGFGLFSGAKMLVPYPSAHPAEFPQGPEDEAKISTPVLPRGVPWLCQKVWPVILKHEQKKSRAL